MNVYTLVCSLLTMTMPTCNKDIHTCTVTINYLIRFTQICLVSSFVEVKDNVNFVKSSIEDYYMESTLESP